MPKCGIFHRGTAVSAVQCSAQIMKQNNHDNSRYCVNSMKNLPANESGCAAPPVVVGRVAAGPAAGRPRRPGPAAAVVATISGPVSAPTAASAGRTAASRARAGTGRSGGRWATSAARRWASASAAGTSASAGAARRTAAAASSSGAQRPRVGSRAATGSCPIVGVG